MQTLRAICRPNKQRAFNFAHAWKSAAVANQMRLVSSGLAAGDSVPCALDLPPAHTSRGAPVFRVRPAGIIFQGSHSRMFDFEKARPGRKFGFPPSVITQTWLQMCALLELFGHHLELSKGRWHLSQQHVWEALPSKVNAASACCNTHLLYELLNLLLHWKLHQYADMYMVPLCTAV